MNEKTFMLFEDLAIYAMESGLEISLEQKQYNHESKGIGNIGGGKTEDTGLILRAFRETVIHTTEIEEDRNGRE